MTGSLLPENQIPEIFVRSDQEGSRPVGLLQDELVSNTGIQLGDV
jgi:hypothetical protein